MRLTTLRNKAIELTDGRICVLLKRLDRPATRAAQNERRVERMPRIEFAPTIRWLGYGELVHKGPGAIHRRRASFAELE